MVLWSFYVRDLVDWVTGFGALSLCVEERNWESNSCLAFGAANVVGKMGSSVQLSLVGLVREIQSPVCVCNNAYNKRHILVF